MRLVDLTLPSAAENLALDEALMLEAEAAAGPVELLRIWEPSAPLVVVGRGSSVAAEVNALACRRDRVPILRRSSGGAAIVTAPGCLMYAVVLSYDLRPTLRPIDQAHQFVLQRLAEAIAREVPQVAPAGTSDLAVAGRKISGNSLRCRKDFLLYHGTVLYGMECELVERYLRMPVRQPEYRAGRSHTDFVANLPITRDALRARLIAAWESPTPSADWPQTLTKRLVAEKYGKSDWNLSIE